MNNYLTTVKKSILCLNKPILNGLSLFLIGILFLGLLSCSSATEATSSTPDTTPPTVVTISTNQSLEMGKTGTLTFSFSEEVNDFTKKVIQFSGGDLSIHDITTGEVTSTDNPKQYSLDITPKKAGTLTINIPANSFTDLSGNKNATNFSTSFSVTDKTSPTVTIGGDTLIDGQSAYLTFIFSEEVTNFTPDDIQFPDDAADKGSFTNNSPLNYSLEITLKKEGALEITIPDKSFEDLYGNQNTKEFTNSFTVHPSTTTTHTISFILNGGKYTSPQITTLQVVKDKTIEQARLGEILSYPPTGPQPSILPITRSISHWRSEEATYNLSTPVTNDLTLEAVWSNSCGSLETVHPKTRGKLKEYTDQAIAANPTTNLNHIDTSAITDMSSLFNGKTSFNGEISCWNTSKVTTMNNMFQSTDVFNQNIGTWNVSQVTDMKYMFNIAGAFNQNIGTWNVSQVTDMKGMFASARAFNQNIGTWNVSQVTDMKGMFWEATAFDQNIGTWNVSQVTDMNSMFQEAIAFDQNIGRWNVSQVTDMRYMFYSRENNAAFNQDIGNWDVSQVTTMRYMFYNANAFNQNIGNWNVSNVTDMNSMFNRANAFNGNIENWNVSQVTTMNNMFVGADTFNRDISTWNVSNVTSMRFMFNGAKAFNKDISTWNVSQVTDMSGMFYGATAFDQNLRAWVINPELTPDKWTDMFTDSAMDGKKEKYPKFDKTPPTLTISTNQHLETGKTGTITFTFSEEVKEFTKDDIQFLPTGVSAGKGKFTTNSDLSYSLEVTPKAVGDLEITIPANSFRDLFDNQNTAFSTNFSVTESPPPTLTINSETLIEGQSASLAFTFSEGVKEFSSDDIQILTSGVSADKGKFTTNTPISYSLEVTPKAVGDLEITIPANSFEGLYGNQSTKTYNTNFLVLSSNTTTHTISFILNGGKYTSPQITTLKVVDGEAIEQARLAGILSYPPTGPQPNILPITREIYQWRSEEATYDLSTIVNSDLTLETVWSNSCGKVETFHPANKAALKDYTGKAIDANSTTNLNHIDTSAITDMSDLLADTSGSFTGKKSFNGKISCWNTSKVNNMTGMFYFANDFDQNIENWNVSSVTSMWDMFNGATAFNKDIGNWNVSNVNNMTSMFTGATAFNKDIGNWNVSSVNNMNSMFQDANAFNQNIGKWNVSSVNIMNSMFNGALAFNQDLSGWSVGAVTSYDDIFKNSPMASPNNADKRPRFP